MRRHPGSIALYAAALLLPALALAQDGKSPAPAAKPPQPAETAPAASADKPDPKAARAASKSARDERQCRMPTSPRLQKKGDECEQATNNTRWHSRDELDSTGATSTAEALRQLNPSVR